MVKPDGVQRGLVGEIVKRFEQKGFKLVAMKFMQASKELLRDHYADLKTKKFFNGLVDFMASGPVVCMVWEGRQIQPSRTLEQSVVIFVCTLEGTFAMAVTQWRVQRRRSHCGSALRSS